MKNGNAKPNLKNDNQPILGNYDMTIKFMRTAMALIFTIFLVSCSNKKRETKLNTKYNIENYISSSQPSKPNKVHNNKEKVKDEKKQSSTFSALSNISNQQQNNNSQVNNHQDIQSAPQTQGEINKERGYDPKGDPILPGQDHAAGSNPDGTPDSWVQGQIDWEKENGYINQDGSPTEKEKQAEAEVEKDAKMEDTDNDY